jgi:hypothetical protein
MAFEYESVKKWGSFLSGKQLYGALSFRLMSRPFRALFGCGNPQTQGGAILRTACPGLVCHAPLGLISTCLKKWACHMAFEYESVKKMGQNECPVRRSTKREG